MSQTEPVRYAPSLETERPEEAEITAAMLAVFAKIQETTFKDYGHAVRGVHAKAHGLLTGRFAVLPDLPAPLAQGLCAASGSYDVVMRFSTNPGDILDDSVSTPRGLAVKIEGVPGDRLPGADGTAQDFVMANAPAFGVPDSEHFLKNLKLLAATTDTPQVFKKALSAVMRSIEAVLEAAGSKSATVVSLGGQPATNILGETFFSQVPIRWGDHVAKVAVAPVSPDLTALTGAHLRVVGKPNALREAVTEFFASHGGEWELRIQLLTDVAKMPIEDASVPWPEDASPYVPVARITVPAQAAWGEAKAKMLDDGMAFNPWHGLEAHRPLGSIMRARRAIYPASVAFRASRNGCPVRV